MKSTYKIILISAASLGLTACNLTTSTLGGLAERDTMVFSSSGAKIESKESSVSIDVAKKTGKMTYDGIEFKSIVALASTSKYTGSDGAVTVDADRVWSRDSASIWGAEVMGLANNETAIAYVVSGTPVSELPTAKGTYVGSFYGQFRKKDGTGITEGASGSLLLNVDFVKGTVSGDVTTLVNASQTAVIPGSVVFTNGKIVDGVVSIDVATKGDLMKNMGFLGGAATGKGEAAFYELKETGITNPNQMLGTGSLESGGAVGVFAFGSTYHP